LYQHDSVSELNEKLLVQPWLQDQTVPREINSVQICAEVPPLVHITNIISPMLLYIVGCHSNRITLSKTSEHILKYYIIYLFHKMQITLQSLSHVLRLGWYL